MKHVLVLGAGHSSPFLVHRLLELAVEHDWFVTVGDLRAEAALALVGAHPRGSGIEFDVNDAALRSTLIAQSDVVVCMLAPQYQNLVAWDCVNHERHMLSVSYQDQTIRDLAPDAQRQGVLLLCELGLDPGLDHMSAMSVIHRLRADGGRVTEFCSYGSGIPAPGQETNPLKYIVTWNPRNVVMSSEQGAQYIEEGQIKIVPWHHVFHHTWPVEVPGVGVLEAYPNRESLSYMEAFGLEHVRTMVRGTLRYPGWSETWAKIVELGLPNEQLRIPDLANRTYAELVAMFLPLGALGPRLEARLAEFLDISPTGRIMDNLRWLGLLSDELIGDVGDTAAAVMIHLLARKLPLTPDLRDMVILIHKLTVEYPHDGRPPEEILSWLVAEGDPGGFTAMARTVGLPTALAVKLLLTGGISLTGAHIPTHPSIYEPILREARQEGLVFEERVEPLTD
ncbi:MAG: saccharopine dehydrogenase C-terminal domain-containing protein [Planctomycetota bacterium]